MILGIGQHRYELVDTWAKLPEGWSFLDVGGLAIDEQDNVYVLNRSEHPIMVFSRDGTLLKCWGEGLFKRAHGSCIDRDGFVYCTDDGNHTVSKFAPDGKKLMELGSKDQPSDTGYTLIPGARRSACLKTIKRGGPPFNCPTGVAVTTDREIYVSDGYGNARVHKFDAAGVLQFSWGDPGSGPGQFTLPHSVRIDKRGTVWVADRENNRIQIFTKAGEFLGQWTDLSRPNDIFFDDNENVYVAELSQRVSIFSTKGELIARWSSQGQSNDTALFIAPHAIAVDSNGDIYVGEVCKNYAGVDRGARTVQKFVHI